MGWVGSDMRHMHHTLGWVSAGKNMNMFVDTIPRPQCIL